MCDIDRFAPLSPLLQGSKYRQTTENTHRSALLFSQEHSPSRRAQPSALREGGGYDAVVVYRPTSTHRLSTPHPLHSYPDTMIRPLPVAIRYEQRADCLNGEWDYSLSNLKRRLHTTNALQAVPERPLARS